MSDEGLRTQVIEGDLVATGLRVAVLASRFNHFIVDRLVEGALDCLRRHGAAEATLVRAPGAWELPLVCKSLVKSGRYDAVVALGAVIRGSTPHFDYVAGEVTKGLASVSLDAGVPVAFGVLTTDSIEQAIERAGTKAGNKGWEAALSAIEMASLQKALTAMASEPGPRRQAREAALQVLYAVDSQPDADVERALAAYWSNLDGPPAGRPYGDQIVRGVTAKREAIDDALRAASPNWRLERMARVDRNLLRIGVWEILHGGAEVPRQVVIDEAVELARTFGAEGAYAFVNGILDKVGAPKKG